MSRQHLDLPWRLFDPALFPAGLADPAVFAERLGAHVETHGLDRVSACAQGFYILTLVPQFLQLALTVQLEILENRCQ